MLREKLNTLHVLLSIFCKLESRRYMSTVEKWGVKCIPASTAECREEKIFLQKVLWSARPTWTSHAAAAIHVRQVLAVFRTGFDAVSTHTQVSKTVIVLI